MTDEVFLLTNRGATVVDKDDYDKFDLAARLWTVSGGRVKAVVSKGVVLHRLITGAKGRRVHVDHINHDNLDNRKINLRLVSNTQNSFNQRKTKNKTVSKYKGVTRDKRTSRWTARIRQQRLGTFDTEREAAECYNEAALRLFGEFACINHIETKPEEAA